VLKYGLLVEALRGRACNRGELKAKATSPIATSSIERKASIIHPRRLLLGDGYKTRECTRSIKKKRVHTRELA
jgi:hypothetical protein